MTSTLLRPRPRFGEDAPEPIPVESSVLDFVRYDERARVLELTFDSGRVYHYLDVPEPIKDGLLEAPSKGIYFNDHIRGQYTYRRIG